MSNKSVLDLFNLSQPVKAGKDNLKIASVDATNAKSSVASETALQIDDWSVRRGTEVLEQSDRLQASKLDELAVADFVAAGFEPEPQLVEACTDSLRHEFVKQLLDTPEYHELHALTQGDVLASEIAASHFAEQFCVLREQRELREKREKKEEKEGKKTGKAPKKDDGFEAEMEAVRAVSKAVKAASKEVEDVNDAASAFGLGEGAKGAGDAAAIANVFNRVRNSESLRRICELAGKFRRLARSKQRQKVAHGCDDVVGITLGDEIGRLVPAELAKLAMPELELDLLRRITEQQAVVREYRGVEPVGKGPIVAWCDESGSMKHGEKIEHAKAICLTLAFIARQQNRWCALVAFGGDEEGRCIVLPPGKWNEVEMCDWIESFINGGTNINVCLDKTPNVYWNDFIAKGLVRGKTDCVLISDAEVEIDAHVVTSFNQWKKAENVHVQSIIIGAEAKELEKVSDEVHLVSSLSVESSAVGDVFSI